MADNNMQATEAVAQDTAFASGEFDALLNKAFRPKTPQAAKAVEAAVLTLAQQALANSVTVSDDAYKSISAIIAQIDFKLTEQLKLILNHPEMQKLESSWRGMEHLVYNTETDEKLKIRFMNLSKDELRRNMKRYKGIAWDQSPLFKKLYEAEYGQLGGEPYGCIIADYYFDHTPPDVDLLGSIAKVAASAHAPFIAGASPSVLQMDSWQELANPRDLTKIVTQNLEYAPWNSLRASEDSRYIGLTMPRFLSRLPYGAKTNPVDEFDFEEDADGADHSKYVWSNAAYAMGVNINRSFKHYGWCTLIRGVESGGAVENLPCHTFPTDDGGVDMKCPTEIAISDRREAELSKNGFIPLIHRKNSDYAAFIGAQSLQKPQEYYDPDATAMGTFDKACNNTAAVRFVQEHIRDSEIIARQLDVPVENILGLAAAESQYGMGRIAREYNNYFFMHGPAPLQSDKVHPLGSARTWVATYSSFLTCGRSFAVRFGNAVRGKKDAVAFVNALVSAGFNTGSHATGGTDGYVKKTSDIIIMVKRRMACSVK